MPPWNRPTAKQIEDAVASMSPGRADRMQDYARDTLAELKAIRALLEKLVERKAR